MAKVNEREFWLERLQQADNVRESVYFTPEHDWIRTSEAHRKVIEELCKGKVLDAGCAYGRTSGWIKNYTGVDICPEFIKIAEDAYPGKKFMVADLTLLPFEDKEFDWAVCISIKAMLIREIGEDYWEKVKAELLRVAKKILILEYSYKGNYEIIDNQPQGFPSKTLA